MTDYPTEAPHATYKVGDLVVPDPEAYRGRATSGVHRIARVPSGRTKNYSTEPVRAFAGPGVRGPASVLHAYTGTLAEAHTENRPGFYLVEPDPYVPLPPLGALVEVTSPTAPIPKGVYVVLGTAQRSTTAVKLARLHGDNDRYYTAVPMKHLSVVEPDRVTIAPKGA